MKRKTAKSFSDTYRDWEIRYERRWDNHRTVVGEAWATVRPYWVYVVLLNNEEQPWDVLAVFDHKSAAEKFAKAFRLVNQLNDGYDRDRVVVAAQQLRNR